METNSLCIHSLVTYIVNSLLKVLCDVHVSIVDSDLPEIQLRGCVCMIMQCLVCVHTCVHTYCSRCNMVSMLLGASPSLSATIVVCAFTVASMQGLRCMSTGIVLQDIIFSEVWE